MKANKTFVVAIILWSVITILRILNHIPWFDEAHSWTIAQELSIPQIFQLMKVEGHMMIWYLMLMPFAKTDFLYPYSMQFLNWVFCLLALIVLWKKAPFNNFVKVLITFSFPFLAVYSVYARCYSVGIFLLFLLVALFKEKLNRPILYSVILVLCANTSVMALFGATAFGILFLYDFFKEKKELKSLIIPSFLFLMCAILILSTFIGSDSSYLILDKGIDLDYFENTFIAGYPIANIIFTILLAVFTILFMRKNPRAFFVLSFTYLCMLYTSIFKWKGHFWNHYFYYIYLIIAFCLTLDESEKIKSKIILTSILSFVSLCLTFNYIFASDDMVKMVFSGKDLVVLKILLHNKNLNEKVLILNNNEFLGYMILPYVRKNGYVLKNYCEDKKINYWVKNRISENDICSFKNSENKKYEKVFNSDLSAERFDELNIKTAYLLDFDLINEVNTSDIFGLKSAKSKYLISKYDCYKKICIWQINKIN